MSAKDWTLLVIAAAQGKPLSPVQLQKALFLLGENLSYTQLQSKGFYKFKPYDYGPFDSQIYSGAEQLQTQGLVVITEPVHRTYREYLATPAGMERAKKLRQELRPEARDYLDRVVGWVRALSFNQLILAIYKHYPKFREKSVFQV